MDMDMDGKFHIHGNPDDIFVENEPRGYSASNSVAHCCNEGYYCGGKNLFDAVYKRRLSLLGLRLARAFAYRLEPGPVA